MSFFLLAAKGKQYIYIYIGILIDNNILKFVHFMLPGGNSPISVTPNCLIYSRNPDPLFGNS
jgi:hypothetical protein